MEKTEIPGLYTDGRGAVVNRDLSEYHALLERRRESMERAAMMDDIAQLRSAVAELRAKVETLMENNK